MKLFISLIGVVLVGGIALGLVRHSEVRELRKQNENLRDTLEEIQRLREENDRLAGYSVDQEQLERLRSEQSELLRLRAEVTKLRRTADATVPELREQIQRTVAEAEDAAAKAELMRARDQAGERSKETQGMLGQLLFVIQQAARESGGPLPGSFQQFELTFNRLPEDSNIRRFHDPEMLNRTNRFGLSARDFEFLPQTRPVTVQDESVLLLREREPRPHPDGGWLRAYGFANGRTEEAFSEDGNFEEWEREARAR